MVKDLIYLFARDEIIFFVELTEKYEKRIHIEQVLRQYFRHFLFTDCFNTQYRIQEHRGPGISYILKVDGFERKLNWYNHFLLKKYIKKHYF